MNRKFWKGLDAQRVVPHPPPGYTPKRWKRLFRRHWYVMRQWYKFIRSIKARRKQTAKIHAMTNEEVIAKIQELTHS